MLSRIAVVKSGSDVPRAVSVAEGAELVHIEAHAVLPPATGALIVGEATPEATMHAALQMLAQHEEILGLLASAIDCREMASDGNSRRVQACAARFGQALGLSAAEMLTLERGALLRDIGKILVPNDVLLKKGVLTYDEWQTIRQHTQFGADIVATTTALSDIADIVLRHHECFDGDGYPDKLEKHEIPVLARIVKIIDVYCAMTTPRHYRKTVASHDDAVAFLQEEAGKHFDPELVKAFVKNKVGAPV